MIMKGMNVSAIAAACGGNLFGEFPSEKEASCVVIDSRLIEKDGVFIATKGERVDGHDFIPQVFEKGALAVVCEKLPENPAGPCILVKDSFEALRKIAAYYRTELDCHVVGITGSVGKTSTKELIASVLRQGKKTCATEKNFNNDIGVPLTVLRIREDDEYAVIEMGINHFGEMSELTKIVHPDTVVFTNIGECHLENLHDRDGVLKAKSEIFEGLTGKGNVIVNASDDKLCSLQEVAGRPTVRYGFDESFDVYASKIGNVNFEGTDTVLNIKGEEELSVHIPLPGKHMVLNACAAAAVGISAGLSLTQIKNGIESVPVTEGRSHIIKTDRFNIIDDCYNANPTSMKAALDLLSGSEGRKAAILGDMFELGADEAELHASVGEYAVRLKTDLLVCIGDLSKNMFKAAEGSDTEAHWYASVDDFIRDASAVLKGADTVLIKASHSMNFGKIVEELK